MSLDAAQTNVTELQDDVAQAAAQQPNLEPVTQGAPNFPELSDARSAWLPTHVAEQAFQTFRRIFEANLAVTHAFYDIAQRQQDFLLATTQTSLAGLPGATTRHVDRALAGVREAYRQNFRMLGIYTSTMLESPSQTVVEPQHPATS